MRHERTKPANVGRIDPSRFFCVFTHPYLQKTRPFPLIYPYASDASGSYSGEGSECGDWRDDPELRGLSASEDGSECDGWRRELGAGEVCENYMDAKFGGEEADMAESRM